MEYLIVFSVMGMMTGMSGFSPAACSLRNCARGENAKIVVVLNTGSLESFALIKK